MQLYTSPASPFCRKVEIVLHETGQRGDVEDIPSAGHPTGETAAPGAANPLGKIPALLRPDGPALFDSRVICRFLNDRAGAHLYPETRLWDVLTLEALGDGISDAAVLMVYEHRSRPEDFRYSPWVEGQWAKIARALDMLQDRGRALLEGPLQIGQIAVVSALGYLDLRHGERDWRSDRPALADWYTACAERPAMQATRPRTS